MPCHYNRMLLYKILLQPKEPSTSCKKGVKNIPQLLFCGRCGSRRTCQGSGDEVALSTFAFAEVFNPPYTRSNENGATPTNTILNEG